MDVALPCPTAVLPVEAALSGPAVVALPFLTNCPKSSGRASPAANDERRSPSMWAVTIKRVGAMVAVAAVMLLSIVVALAGIGVGPIRLGRVKGTSMLPTLHPGDAVITLRARQYHVGEVVAYRNKIEGRTIVHRIVWTDGRHFTFKGDHNPVDDALVTGASAIAGRKVAVLPVAGDPWAPPVASALILLALWAPTLLKRGPHLMKHRPSPASILSLVLLSSRRSQP